jgi:hypothetical protein
LRLAALAEAPAAFGSTLSDWSGPGDTEERWRARLASVAHNIVLEHGGSPAVLSVKPTTIRLYRRHGFTDVGPSPNDPDERLLRLT